MPGQAQEHVVEARLTQCQPGHFDLVLVERPQGLGGHLLQRVYTGIGAARAGNLDRAAFHVRQDFFQRSLNGRQTGLHLPAVKSAAIVGEADQNAAHRGFRPAANRASPRVCRGGTGGSLADSARLPAGWPGRRAERPRRPARPSGR